jgi:hypothetical protein
MEDSASPYPTPEAVREWLKNHVCVPAGGVPKWFVEKLTKSADDSKAPNMI